MLMSPQLSVIIPTYRRRLSLERALHALARQTMPSSSYEVIVSIDGSEDGTQEMVAGFQAPYALRCIWQSNKGRGAACNAGIHISVGEVLVLLDDDMEPAPGCLICHAQAHLPGSRYGVMGAVPISPGVAAPPIATYIGAKFNEHLEKLSQPDYRLMLRDFYSGNFSIRREILLAVGGFDEDFRVYGNEDLELSLRLTRAGVKLMYKKEALAYQHYTKDFSTLARDTVSKGQTAVLLASKYPETFPDLQLAHFEKGSRGWRWLRAGLLLLSRIWAGTPNGVIAFISWLEERRPNQLPQFYRLALDYCYWLGVRAALLENRRIGRGLISLKHIDERPNSVYSGVPRGTSLRQMDWRFLLPLPPERAFEHLVLLGGSVGLAERIIEVGFAKRVTQEVPVIQSADALIILHEARVALAEAAHSLLPGGVFYYEVERPWFFLFLTTLGRIKRSLEDIGLSQTGIYWVWPNFSACQAYFPLNHMEMLLWYLTSIAVTAALTRRLFELMPGLLRWFGNRFFPLLARCCAVTGIAGSPSDTPPALLQNPSLPIVHQQSGLLPLMLTPGEDDLNRVVIFAGAADRTQPSLVFKLWRSPDQNAAIKNEQAIMAEIRAALDDGMRRTIPEPLGVHHWGQLLIGVESCALGRSLSTSLYLWGMPLRQKVDDLRLVAGWLTEFHGQIQVRQLRWDSPELTEWVERPLASYQQAFGVTVTEQRLFSDMRKCAAALVGLSLPLIWVHRGFSERNFFRDDREITIIDWERAVPGLPLVDLIYFVTYWSYRVRRLRSDAARLRGFRKLFCEPEPADLVSVAVHQSIAQYLSKLDLDRRFFPLLLVLMWMERALGRYVRQGKPAELGDARSRNAYVAYIAALAEYHDRLFAGTYEK